MIYIDCQGTIVGNPRLPLERALQLVQDLGPDARLCSGAPALAAQSLPTGVNIVDKLDLFRGTVGADDILVDDDDRILAAWRRLGGIGVRADDFADWAVARTTRVAR